MAFTAAQLLTLGEILGMTPLEIDDHFDTFPYDSDTETYVETELTAWATARDGFAYFTATESNEGFNLSLSSKKAAIRERVALALGLDVSAFSGSRLVRA